MIRSYSELMKLDSYVERFRYLKCSGAVGADTFGSLRYLNQQLYSSKEWRRFRRDIIIRDQGMDLGMDGYSIEGEPIIIHHINPLTSYQMIHCPEVVMDPENVICVRGITHKAIHYGDESLLIMPLEERRPNDTCPWKN